MFITKLYRFSSFRNSNKLKVTMSQKSLFSFFQRKTADDTGTSPLKENVSSKIMPKPSPKTPKVKIYSKKKISEEQSPEEMVEVSNMKKKSKKRKRSEERPVEKSAEKPVSESASPEIESMKIEEKETDDAGENEATDQTQPTTPVLKTLSYLGSKKSSKKSKSKTPAKKKNVSPTEIKAAKKSKVEEENKSEECKTKGTKTDELVEDIESKKIEIDKKQFSDKKRKKSSKVDKIIRKTDVKIGRVDEDQSSIDLQIEDQSSIDLQIEDHSSIDLQIEDSRGDDITENDSSNISNKPKVAAFLNFKKDDCNETVSYDPSKERYDPIKDAFWEKDERVPYLALAKTLQKVEETSARLKIISILSNYFRSVIALNKKDLLPSIYLCLNQLGPAYNTPELGIADTYLMKAVAQCTGRSLAQIKSDVAETGDLGVVAEQSRSNQRIMFRPSPLTVRSVFNQLIEIASISGQSAVNKKIDKIQALFVSCRDCEARFVIRCLAGKLRIGLAEQSVIQALALACTTTPPSDEFPPKILDASKKISADEFKKRTDEELLILKSTYSECPNYNLIVPVLLEKGLKALPEFCKITPGIPVKPMLAQPTKGVQEVLQRFEGMKFTCEWKYDGERAQIHILENGSVKLYSRNMEDNTSKYPDVISEIRQFIKPEVKSCILDAESVAWDSEQQKIMPFQILSTRKRKAADINEIKVQVCVHVFDLLYLNGESFIQKPLVDRRNALKDNFVQLDNKFVFVKSIDTNTMEQVEEFLEESVKGNCEGLMIKTLDVEATYEIAKRSRNWLKLKKDYLDGCGDTLDLVVIGGYIGKGKRTGQYGGFLLASYDGDNEEYQSICKIGTGFSEEALAKHTENLKKLVIPKAKPYYRYDSSHEPDFWFDAVQVWEVKCADLSLSPIYYSAIGLVDPEKGISLRFPRFLRVRDDKSTEQATSSNQVADLYKNQDQIKNQTNVADKFNEEDF